MRNLSDGFLESNLALAREPIVVAKILNDTQVIYITSKDVNIVDGGSVQFQGVITSFGGNSQDIVPERGYSTIGGMSFSFNDLGFTEHIRDVIKPADDSLNNNKVEIYYGFVGLAFSDFLLVMPMYINDIGNSDLTFTLGLSDTQRFKKKSLFADLKKTFVVSSPRRASTGIGAGPIGTIEIEVGSTAGFEMVEHHIDDNWANRSGDTVGYLKISGTAADGTDIKEIMSYDGFDVSPPRFTGVVRGEFGTGTVDLQGGVTGEDDVDIIECVYLDLVAPKMMLALLTGSLYGQVGKTIPSSWHAGVDASLIDTVSYEDIGGDLWETHLEFRDIDKQSAKEFIAKQCMAPVGVFDRINQNGELALKRYTFQSQISPGDIVLSHETLTNIPAIKRNFKSIRNNFLINWGWRVDKDFYGRVDAYLDVESEQKFNISSEPYSLNLRGLRNRDETSKPTLDLVASSIITRFSNPSIVIEVKGLLRNLIEIEVGDVVTLDLPNLPDYDSADTLLASFEVQKVSWDFLTGTGSLKLFTSSGTPSEFIPTNGSNVTNIDHTGWTDLSGSAHGTDDLAGTFTFNATSSVSSSVRYYFDGDVIFPSGSVTTTQEKFVLDADNITLEATAKIDGAGKGINGVQGYFGGIDSAQEGLFHHRYGFADSLSQFKRRSRRSVDTDVDPAKTSIDFASVTRLTDGQSINSIIPAKLFGNGGGEGSTTRVSGFTDPTGGATSRGGAGVFFSCNNLFYSSGSSVVDLSGADNNVGNTQTDADNRTWHAGSGGFGWPGVMIVAIKDRSAALPFLHDLVLAKTGAFNEGSAVENSGSKRPRKDGSYQNSTPGDYDYRPTVRVGGSEFAEIDYAKEGGSAYKAVRFILANDHVPEVGVDSIGTSKTPALALTETLNTPRTPLGNISTITATVNAAAGDTDFSYALIHYRLQGDIQWSEFRYGITTESSIEVTSSGDIYEVRATAYNKADKPGGVVTETITTTVVTSDTGTSEGAQPSPPAEITLPNISNLVLINQALTATTFKSGNAEFKWDKLASTVAGNIVTLDPHFSTFKIVIKDSVNTVMRTEYTRDSFYTYTHDQNITDGCGRVVKIDVSAFSTTAYETPVVQLVVDNPLSAAVSNSAAVLDANGNFTVTFDLPTDVDFVAVDVLGVKYTSSPILIKGPLASRSENVSIVSYDEFGIGSSTTVTCANPAPAAATSVNLQASYTSVQVDFTVDSADIDYVGVAFFWQAGSPADVYATGASKRFDGATHLVFDGLSPGTQYTFGITSYDEFGVGSSTAQTTLTTPFVAGADVSGLGNWAYETSPVDLTFIQANMDTGAIPSDQIVSLVAGKITAGTITAQVEIGTGAQLDGTNGLVKTTAVSGYNATMGSHSVPAESSNALMFSVNSGATYPFWIDAAGEAKFAGTLFLQLNGGAANLAIGASTTWQSTGIQLQYNSGTPRMFIGDLANEKYIEFDGTDINIGRESSITGVKHFNNPDFFHYMGGFATWSTTGSVTTSTGGTTVNGSIQAAPSAAGSGVMRIGSGVPDIRFGDAFNISNPFRHKARFALAVPTSGSPSSVNYFDVAVGNTEPGASGTSSADAYGVHFRHNTDGTWEAAPFRQQDGTFTFGTFETCTKSFRSYELEIIKTATSTVNISLTDLTGSTTIFDVAHNYSCTTTFEVLWSVVFDINTTEGNLGYLMYVGEVFLDQT